LSQQNFDLGPIRRKPLDAIDFGEGLHSPALRRPFQLEPIGPERGGIKRALDGERDNNLPTRLHDFTELDEVAVRSRAEFFFELADGTSERLLGLVIFAFRNRPGALVLLRPEWATRMREQHFELG